MEQVVDPAIVSCWVRPFVPAGILVRERELGMNEHADQATVAPLVIPEVVTLPAEIDIGNAERIGRELCAAARPGVKVIIADMSLTEFCDSSGVRSLVFGRDAANAIDAELRLVIPSAAVLRVLSLMGLDPVFQIYPSLGLALTASPR
jgi:anti-sigma B factor antagonist